MKVLELESMLDNERMRLGELRKKHYEIAGVPLEQMAQDNGLQTSYVTAGPPSPKPSKPNVMKKPALAQKPNILPKSPVTIGLVTIPEFFILIGSITKTFWFFYSSGEHVWIFDAADQHASKTWSF